MQQNQIIRRSRVHVQCKKSSTDGWRCQEAKDFTLSGSEFHRVGAATEKARVPAFVLTLGNIEINQNQTTEAVWAVLLE